MSYNRYNTRRKHLRYPDGPARVRHYLDKFGSHIPSGPLKYIEQSYRKYRSPREPHRYVDSDTALTTPLHSPNRDSKSPAYLRPASGTDPQSGKNSQDDKHGVQMHHLSYLSTRPGHSSIDLLKNYRVVYDPELDKTLSKAEKKKKHRKLRFQTEHVDSAPADPRVRMGLQNYLNKPNKNSTRFPFKQLPQVRFTYDKNLLGLPPQSELVMWDLPTTVSEVYLVNFFESYGDTVKDMKFINDPMNAVPLGIATFSFPGTPEKALRTAKKLLKRLRDENPKIDGVELKIALNDAEDKLLRGKIEVAQGKLRDARLKLEKAEKIKREKEEQKEKEQKQAVRRREETPAELLARKRNTTTLSVKHHNKVIHEVFLPDDLVRYVKDRPFVYINDKYVPTRKILSQEVKKVLMKYDWTRVLLDKTGYYVVFNTLKECERCFHNEDGVRFFEYRLFMELCVPEKFVGDENVRTKNKGHDVVDEAANMLIKEFQTYLSKDIRERIIAPTVLDLLRPENYPDLVKEVREKQDREKQEVVEKPDRATLYLFLVERKAKASPVLLLPLFSKKQNADKKKKNLFPMQHALNYDDHESEESDDDETSRSATPAVTLKRELTPDESPKIKRSKLSETFMYDDEDVQDAMEVDVEKPDDATVDARYDSTVTFEPQLVYDEIVPQAGSIFDLQRLQEIIRDDEDMVLARKLLQDTEPSTIRHLEYWAWKQRQLGLETVISEEESVGLLSERLECPTGSFKSEGYRKIADADKGEYLPHRRRIYKPLNVLDAEESSSTPSNNVPSLRVNRANNRRFAADISAQKQILSTESDILNLNALTKRKKPVSFARSAIHNWGLYALEPVAAKEMIIEYVGESIRQQVAEHREKSYMRTGIGSSYLFRIDENTVIDATKKGGIARFINHCCSPSCTAKIIKVDGKKRIVIYALRDIEANEELTYDYKFERETNDNERIPCLCGAPGCKGYLN